MNDNDDRRFVFALGIDDPGVNLRLADCHIDPFAMPRRILQRGDGGVARRRIRGECDGNDGEKNNDSEA